MGDNYIAERCIPSYLGSRTAGYREDSGIFSSVQLLQGEVKKVIYPGDPHSNSKNCVEYSVDVEYRQGAGPACTMTFPNCRISNMFGGIADICRYTLRPNPAKSPKGTAFGNGSKVLVLCLWGERNRGYIVGGIRDDTTVDQGSLGHNYYWEFNGISQTINKDGEYIFQFGGPTKVDGLLDTSGGVKASDVGTTATFTKDGSYEMYTQQHNQFIKLDHTNKKIEIRADDELDIGVTKNDCNMNIGGYVNIKSDGVLIGSATDNFPLFSTYRQAEATLHQSLVTALTQAAAQLAAAAAALSGGPAAGASPGLTATGAAMTQMATAISNFEGQSNTYLSPNNKND